MAGKRLSSVQDIFQSRYTDLVRFLRYRLTNAADADDLAQEAFMRLWRRSREELVERPEPYLFRIAANLAYEQRLKSTTDITIDPVTATIELVDTSESPERRAMQHQRLQRLGRVLATLPPMPRAALILQRRDGLTYAEIAQRLGTTPHMVKKHIATALQRCRHVLETDNDG